MPEARLGLTLQNLYEVLSECDTCLPRLDELVWRTGYEAREVAAIVARAIAKGMVGLFDDPLQGPHVHLTQLAAERLDLVATEADEPRWVPREAKPPKLRTRNRWKFGEGSYRRHPDNDKILESLTEEDVAEDRPRAWDADNPPRTYQVYGMRAIWPVPGQDTVVPVESPLPIACPGCDGRPLGVHDYCAICGRHGFDKVIDAHWDKHGRPGSRRAYLRDKLKGGTGA